MNCAALNYEIQRFAHLRRLIADYCEHALGLVGLALFENYVPIRWWKEPRIVDELVHYCSYKALTPFV